MWDNIDFVNPQFFYLLLIIPALVLWYWFKYKQNYAQLNYSGLNHLKGVPKTIRQRLIHSPFILKMIILALLIVALARPQSTASQKNISVKGIDIVMARFALSKRLGLMSSANILLETSSAITKSTPLRSTSSNLEPICGFAKIGRAHV